MQHCLRFQNRLARVHTLKRSELHAGYRVVANLARRTHQRFWPARSFSFSARTHWGRPLEASQYEFIVRESVVEVHFHRIEIPTVSTLGNALRSFFSISSKLFSLHLVWFII